MGAIKAHEHIRQQMQGVKNVIYKKKRLRCCQVEFIQSVPSDVFSRNLLRCGLTGAVKGQKGSVRAAISRVCFFSQTPFIQG